RRRPRLRGADEELTGLVRAPVRAGREPGEHPARRGDPARDAPPRAPRRHAEGGLVARGSPWFPREPPPCDRRQLIVATPSLQLPDVEALSAEDVIRWAHDRFGDRLCLTCSWQKQSSVLVHMVSELGIEIDVIELDTHLFFRESYETR